MVGSIALSGARGVSKVELRINGGAWQEAQQSPPLSETTWVVWRYDWPFQSGMHTFEVRCVEGEGVMQINRVTPSHPRGATGLHILEVDMQGKDTP